VRWALLLGGVGIRADASAKRLGKRGGGLELAARLSSVLEGAFQGCSNWQADSGSSKASSRVKSLSQESVFRTRLRELIARPEMRTRTFAPRASAFMRETFVVPNDMNVTLTHSLQRPNCPWEKWRVQPGAQSVYHERGHGRGSVYGGGPIQDSRIAYLQSVASPLYHSLPCLAPRLPRVVLRSETCEFLSPDSPLLRIVPFVQLSTFRSCSTRRMMKRLDGRPPLCNVTRSELRACPTYFSLISAAFGTLFASSHLRRSCEVLHSASLPKCLSPRLEIRVNA
jgi:hypothetical protein